MGRTAVDAVGEVEGILRQGTRVIYLVSTCYRRHHPTANEAVFTMKLEPELRAEFMVAAAAEDRPDSQILREMIREYIQRQRQARDYPAKNTFELG